MATAVTSTIALKKGQLAQGLDAQFGTLIHALPQLSWAEAFSGASDTHRNPDFKLPAPVEEAWAGAYAAMGKKMAWQVDLDGQPGTVIALSPGAADRGVRFAVFDADGKCLSSGYARETSEGWATESKGTEPIWVTERHEQQLQQQRAAADQARLADEYRAAQAQAPAASVAQREYASKLVAQAFRGQGPAAMLVPAPGQPQGFRAAQVTPYHAAGFAIEAARVPEWAPAPELLAEVAQGAPQRPLLVPEVYSETVGRNVRFAVFLPPGFDPSGPRSTTWCRWCRTTPARRWPARWPSCAPSSSGVWPPKRPRRRW
ncbi:MAG: hypothetical protein IPJ65_24385 [Archangiaceae bacterium]|nr:hypothetical protein [Archangiaceae bacterium]